MKIGFDAKRIYHNRTGLGNYSRDLVSILSKKVLENTYYLYNPKNKKIDRLDNAENIIEVLPKSWIWKQCSSIWRQGPVVRQLRKDNIEVFHGLSGEIPRGLESTKIKSVVTIHDLIFIRYPELYKFMDRKIHFKKFLFAVKNADVVVAISEQTKRDVVAFLGIDPNKIRVIYQGCHNFFKTECSIEFKKNVEDKFSLPKKFILNVGTIEERKNLMTLVKAIKDLDVVLVVVGGKTPYFKEVLEYIEENKIHKKVKFLENVDLKELVALYQMASLFVYPSVFEGFGIPIIEALYSKTPVITSTGSCFSEAGGANSIYVNPNDIEDLSNKISLVLKDEKLRDDMIDKGFKFVQKFNDDMIAQKYGSIYNSLIN